MFTKLTTLDVLVKTEDSMVDSLKVGTIEFSIELSEEGKKDILLFNPHHKKFTAKELREVATIMDFNAKREIEEYGGMERTEDAIDDMEKEDNQVFVKRHKKPLQNIKKKFEESYCRNVESTLKGILVKSLELGEGREDIIGMIYDGKKELCTVTIKVTDKGDSSEVYFGSEVD